MGSYTEFFFRAELKEFDSPLVDWFEQYADKDREHPDPFEDHPFFSSDRWQSAIWGGGAVYQITRGLSFARGNRSWLDYPRLFIHSSLKNYGSETAMFLDWIMPHVRSDAGDFLGYSLGEDSRPYDLGGWYGQDDGTELPDHEQPNLIFYPEVLASTAWRRRGEPDPSIATG